MYIHYIYTWYNMDIYIYTYRSHIVQDVANAEHTSGGECWKNSGHKDKSPHGRRPPHIIWAANIFIIWLHSCFLRWPRIAFVALASYIVLYFRSGWDQETMFLQSPCMWGLHKGRHIGHFWNLHMGQHAHVHLQSTQDCSTRFREWLIQKILNQLGLQGQTRTIQHHDHRFHYYWHYREAAAEGRGPPVVSIIVESMVMVLDCPCLALEA